jgi:hypothetical protein
VSSKDFLTTLYESGISTEELRLLYLDETVGLKIWDEGVGEFDAKPNPYIAYSRIELKEALRALPSSEAWDYDREEIELTRQALRVAERTAIEALTTAAFIALGYSASSKGKLVAIPPYQWRFLEPDIHEGKAEGEGIRYDGIKCIKQDTLSDKDKKLLEGAFSSPQSSPTKEESIAITPLSFDAIGAIAWSQVTIRLLKNDFAEVCGPDKSLKVSLDALGLMNKTEQKPNKAFDDLLNISKGLLGSSAKKQAASQLRKTLKKSLATDGDPIRLQGTRYALVFTLVDDRKAADERAESDAIHVEYRETHLYETAAPEETYTFTDENEGADERDKLGQKWIKKNASNKPT